VDYDYSKRSYLLPEGCKDLTDVIPMTAITEHGFVVTVRLAGLQSRDIEVVALVSTLRILAKQSGHPFVSTIEVPVPSDYAPARARATYFKGQLRIVVPKAAAPSDAGVNGEIISN
jgi:HSP20 family molecular chaperone IbpA